jgi:predicted nucleic acid-binding protein
MTATSDLATLIILLKHKAIRLLSGAYSEILVPMSIIEEVPTTSLDDALSEGWIQLMEADTNYLMRVDETEARSGIKLSVDEEGCIALSLQYEAHPVVTSDRQVETVAELLGITTEGIPSAIIGASRSGMISEKESLKIFHEIYEDLLPGFGVEGIFLEMSGRKSSITDD